MTDQPITPPVPDATSVDLPAQVANDLTLVQRFVQADKAVVIAALIHITVLLLASLNMHLTAEQTAEVGTVVTVGLTYFLGVHFRKK